jgi:hypothetical protein
MLQWLFESGHLMQGIGAHEAQVRMLHRIPEIGGSMAAAPETKVF